LTLFVTRIIANYPQHTFTTDHFAFAADPLY